MKSITLKLTGFDELETFLTTAKASTKKVVQREFNDAANKMKALIQKDAPVNYKQLRLSINKEVKNVTDIIIESKVSYAPYMEFGTKTYFNAPADLTQYAATFKGKGEKSDIKPYNAILAWVQHKKLGVLKKFNAYNVKNNRPKVKYKNRDARDKALAGMIWNTIKKKGVQRQTFFFSDKAGNSRIPVFTKILIDHTSNALNTIFGD